MLYDKTKTFGILFGIIISVFLIGNQLSILFAMMEGMKGVAKNNTAYIWVLNKKTESAMQFQNLNTRVGNSLYSIKGVHKVHPVIIGSGSAKFPKGSKTTVSIFGVASPDFFGAPKQYTPGTNLFELINEGAVIVDKTALNVMENIQIGDAFTINDKNVYLSGLSLKNTGFGTAIVITTLERARILAGMKNIVSAYILEIDSTQATKLQIIKNINSSIPGVKSMLGMEFANETLSYMMRTSNIAMSFGFMVGFAFIAGFFIVGLTLYSSVNDRIRDYGTIKAIGGNNNIIRKLILYQAVMYAAIGFSISFGLLLIVKQAMSGGSLQLFYPPVLIIGLIIVTLAISIAGCLFALRKIIKLEPVQIFRM